MFPLHPPLVNLENKKPNRTGRTEPNRNVWFRNRTEPNRTEPDRTLTRSNSAGWNASKPGSKFVWTEPNRTDQLSKSPEAKRIEPNRFLPATRLEWVGVRGTGFCSVCLCFCIVVWFVIVCVIMFLFCVILHTKTRSPQRSQPYYAYREALSPKLLLGTGASKTILT